MRDLQADSMGSNYYDQTSRPSLWEFRRRLYRTTLVLRGLLAFMEYTSDLNLVKSSLGRFWNQSED